MKTTVKVALGLLTLALCVWPTHRSFAAFDAFLKIDGIPGESTDPSHTNEIEILSWSWGETQSGSAVPGPGVTNRVTMRDFHFVMRVNKASPKLMLACASGTNITKIVLTCRKAGEQQQEFLIYEFQDVIVSSYSSGGNASASGSGDPVPTESISFNFAKIKIEYQVFDPIGAPSGPPVIATWDIVANQPY